MNSGNCFSQTIRKPVGERPTPEENAWIFQTGSDREHSLKYGTKGAVSSESAREVPLSRCGLLAPITLLLGTKVRWEPLRTSHNADIPWSRSDSSFVPQLDVLTDGLSSVP